ncbi:MAG: hypothetical protein H7336_02665 [Bacteriovorax sp.]|nr:hypothetical protein [Bacteriovorax sp.]
MKTVYLKTDGDSFYGLGHVYRSIALAKFIDENNLKTIFVTDKPVSSELVQALQQANRIFITCDDLLKSHKDTDYLIYDMPYLDEVFINATKKLNFVKKIGLDFFYYENDFIDSALNLFSHGDPKKAIFKIKESIAYAILREPILSSVRALEVNQSVAKKILITFGSTDPKNNTCSVMKVIPDKDQIIDIILGPLFNHNEELKKVISNFKNSRINIFKNVSNMEDFILNTGYVICGGGTTLLETIYLCKPAIVVAQTAEELNFARSLEAQGLCCVIESNSLDAVDFNQFSQFEFQQKLTNGCKNIENGSGKKLILEELLG